MTDAELALSILTKLARIEDAGDYLLLSGTRLVVDGWITDLTPDEVNLLERLGIEPR